MDDESLIDVLTTNNPTEAYFLRDVLESAGIQAVVIGDIILAGGTQLPYPRVQVHQRNKLAADAILKSLREQTS